MHKQVKRTFKPFCAYGGPPISASALHKRSLSHVRLDLSQIRATVTYMTGQDTTREWADLDIGIRTFLDTITRGRPDEAWLASVPNIADSPPGYWFGMRYEQFRKQDHADSNIYYSLGLINGGQRRLDHWAAGTLIALDDVGEKSGEAQAVRDALGDPTFVIQTSHGSQQWGYVLSTAVTDMTTMARLQRALTLKFYPKQKDPGHERVIQYLRLPGGVNNKPARLEENGGDPQRVRLVEWRPDVKLDPLDVMMALEGAWELTEHMSLSASGLAGPATEEAARAYLGSDGILAGLDLAGMTDWGRIGNGYIGIRCPWEDQHTGVNDDRAGYNPDSRHFMCFHGSHGPKSTADIDDWLRATVGQPYIDMRVDMARKAFASKPLPPDTDEPAERPARGRDLVSIWAAPPAAPLPARRSICSHLARGEVTYRIGAPAIGKSALALAYAAAIGADRADLAGEPALTRTGPVIIVSNEDSADDYRKRLVGLLRKHALLGQPPVHDILVTPTQNFAVVVKEDRYSPIALGDDMAWLAERVRKHRACLVMIDTQAATFRGIQENDNADMGAAMSLVAGWAKENNVAVEVLHHTTKSNGRTEGAGDLTAARGAGAAGASVRNQVNMQALTKEQMRKLPPGEGASWVKETGAKGNHSGNAGTKWWQREIIDVIVVDPDTDEPQTQAVPVYVYSARPPKIIFYPDDPDNLLQVINGAAEAERNDEPFRVSKGRGDMATLAENLADRHEWDLDDALAAIKEAQRHGLLEPAPWKNPKTRKDVSVWSVTAKGLERLAEGENVLTEDNSVV
jgi:hypothetical protein